MPRMGDVPQLVTAAARDFWIEIQTTDGPPLPSITLIPESRPKTVTKIAGDTVERAVELSHETAQKLSRQAAVCIEVWDGHLTTKGLSTQAILINLWIEGHGPIFFARRYRRDPFELFDDLEGGTDNTAPPAPPSELELAKGSANTTSNEDAIKVVQEAVRQFGGDIQQFEGDILPAIVLSDEPPKIKVVNKIEVEKAKLIESVKFSHETALRLAKNWAVCVETWDGYATVDGEKFDAILVNYWVDGRGPVFFAQRYRRSPFRWVGEAIAGEMDISRLES